ncbi:MAG TPA: NAD(P)-dependent oxidoreductase [Gaiellaceae bacterium]|nr:NAD(P)-dependent oxidoreductase [Gaiellaceae bacterium]
MSTIGVVGLGAMGSRIAGRLLGAGHELVVWNRTRAKAEPLAARGALVALSPADAAARADIVITMVRDADALRAVVTGDEGVAAAAPPTLIEMSTVGPRAIEWLAAAVPARTCVLDAPVLGSIGEAEAGILTIFVGGPATLVAQWTPLLAVLGNPIHAGALGAGAAAKLVANSTLFGTIAVLGEAVALGDALGLTRGKTFEILAATPIAAQAERRRAAIERHEYPPRFALSLARKDADLVTEAAASTGIDVRLAAAAASWLSDAEQGGRGSDDYAAVLAQILADRPH